MRFTSKAEDERIDRAYRAGSRQGFLDGRISERNTNGWEGDGSTPEGTLVPIWSKTLVEPCPRHQWDYCDGRISYRCFNEPVQMPDLRGFLGCPTWMRCLNGQTSSNTTWDLQSTTTEQE